MSDTKALTPDGLANQLFDAALMQFKDPREASMQVVTFLANTLIYMIFASVRDPAARQELQKQISEQIASAAQSGK